MHVGNKGCSLRLPRCPDAAARNVLGMTVFSGIAAATSAFPDALRIRKMCPPSLARRGSLLLNSLHLRDAALDWSISTSERLERRQPCPSRKIGCARRGLLAPYIDAAVLNPVARGPCRLRLRPPSNPIQRPDSKEGTAPHGRVAVALSSVRHKKNRGGACSIATQGL